jgi:hypothetical protein
MPVWLFILLAAVVVVAVLLAVLMAYNRRSATGQHTVIVERPANDQSTTVIEKD